MRDEARGQQTKATMATRKFDGHQKRLLSRELNNLNSIQYRQAKNRSRDQMEVKRELMRLTQEKRQRHLSLSKAGQQQLKTNAQLENSTINRNIKHYLSLPVGLTSVDNDPHIQDIKGEFNDIPAMFKAIESGETLNVNHHPSKSLSTSSLVNQRANGHLKKSDSMLLSAVMQSPQDMNKFGARGNTLQPINDWLNAEDVNKNSKETVAGVTELPMQGPCQVETSRLHVGSIALSEKCSVKGTDLPSIQESLTSGKLDGQTQQILNGDPLIDDLYSKNGANESPSLQEKTHSKLQSQSNEKGKGTDALSLTKLDDDVVAMRTVGKGSDAVWRDVRHCRYLRGYEPPLMVLPDDTSRFVFGKPSSDIYQQHLNSIAQAVKSARQHRAAATRENKAMNETAVDPTKNLRPIKNQQLSNNKV